MGRDFFEIYFKCECGKQHETNVVVAFLNNPSHETSAADVYRGRALPEALRLFLERPFTCPHKNEVQELPNLEGFFFAPTNESTMIVG